MKRILILFLCFVISVVTGCKTNSVKNDSYFSANSSGFFPESLENGIDVLFKTCSYSRTSTLCVVIDGGVSFIPPKKSGLEGLVLQLLTDNARAAVRQVSVNAAVSYSVEKDFSVYSLSCPDEEFSDVFPVFLKSFTSAEFDEEVFDSAVDTAASDIQKYLSTPEGTLFSAAQKTVYEGYPYLSLTKLSSDSVKNISFSDVLDHYRKLQNASRLRIVASGNFSKGGRDSILETLQNILGILDKNDFTVPRLSKISLKQKIIYEQCDAAESDGYLFGCFSSPSPADSDYIPFALVTEYLDDILYRRIVIESKAAESVGTGILKAKETIGIISIYKASEDSDIKSIMDDVLESFPDEKEIARNLGNYKNKYISDIYSSTNSTSNICRKIIFSLEYFNDPKEWTERVAEVESVTPKQVYTCFKKYLSGFQWIIVSGNPDADKFGFED